MSEILFRPASADDLPALVSMLADDPLGATRESPALPLDPGYRAAFDAITADGNQMLLVAALGEAPVGFLQISFIPGLSRRGQWRGQIESVRVSRAHRGRGLGRRLVEEALRLCEARGCALAQLTSDKTREDALRFYRSLGFSPSHEGLKCPLPRSEPAPAAERPAR